jgi:hypothetical protein
VQEIWRSATFLICAPLSSPPLPHVQRQKLLNMGRHVQQKLRMLTAKIEHEKHERQASSVHFFGSKPLAGQGVDTAFFKANAAFAHAMAVEAGHRSR